jgi:hypothetical protein
LGSKLRVEVDSERCLGFKPVGLKWTVDSGQGTVDSAL